MTTDQEDALFDMQLIIDDVLLKQSRLLQYLKADGRFDLNAPLMFGSCKTPWPLL